MFNNKSMNERKAQNQIAKNTKATATPYTTAKFKYPKAIISFKLRSK